MPVVGDVQRTFRQLALLLGSMAGPGIAAPASIDLAGPVRDFFVSHPDMEYVIADDRGIVKPLLGPDGKPVYANPGGTTMTTNGEIYFDQWFRDVPGVNQSVPFAITLVETAPGSGIFSYEDLEFYPIDGQLWGNEGYQHNYHFTYQIHSRFTYRGGERFTFTGDDDVWVFIAKQLVIDLGGVHGPESATVDLDAVAGALGLVVGQGYDFDFFFAERHCCGSHFRIDTSLFICPAVLAAASAPAAVCLGQPVMLDGAGSSGCGGSMEYRWLAGTNVLCPWSADPTCSDLPAAVTTYTLETRCAAEPTCEASANVDVEVVAPPEARAAAPARLCLGESVVLDGSGSSGCAGTGGLEHRWRAGAVAVCPWSAVPTCTVVPTAGTTTYSLDVRCAGVDGCEASTTVDVQAIPSPIAAAGPDRDVCDGEPLTLDGSGSTDRGCPAGLEYRWRDGATVVRGWSASPTWDPPTAAAGTTVFTLDARCAGDPGCSASDDVEVVVTVCAPLAVAFASYGATWVAGCPEVAVAWATASEQGTLAFAVERAGSRSGPFTVVATVPTSRGRSYEIRDTAPAGAGGPWYRVVELTSSGRGSMTATFTPAQGAGAATRARRREPREPRR